MKEIQKISQKTINNAVAAYLMILISWAFLLNSSNESIKNDFVRSHTKVAFLMHIGLLLTVIIFVWFDFLKWYFFLDFSVNHIVATSIFTTLFLWMLYWMYSAMNGKKIVFTSWEKVLHVQKISHIWKNNVVEEEDILTLILTHIPFIWYIIQGLHWDIPAVKNISHLNMIISIIIMAIFLLWYGNIASLLSLFYIIAIVFSSIHMLIQGSLIWIDVSFIPTPERKIIIQTTLIAYLKNYFGKTQTFVWFSELQKHIISQRAKSIEKQREEQKGFPDFTLPLFLIYMPFVNIITIPKRHSQYNTHIMNGLYITVISLCIIILSLFGIVNIWIWLFLLFPICFGIGYAYSQKCYRMPYVYDLHLGVLYIVSFFKTSKKILKEKHKEEHEVSFSSKRDK